MLHNETLDLIPLNDYKRVCNSYAIYIVLFAIFFIIFYALAVLLSIFNGI